MIYLLRIYHASNYSGRSIMQHATSQHWHLITDVFIDYNFQRAPYIADRVSAVLRVLQYFVSQKKVLDESVTIWLPNTNGDETWKVINNLPRSTLCLFQHSEEVYEKNPLYVSDMQIKEEVQRLFNKCISVSGLHSVRPFIKLTLTDSVDSELELSFIADSVADECPSAVVKPCKIIRERNVSKVSEK